MTDLFEKVPEGFVDLYGIKWEQPQVDLYNQISKEIHDREIAGFPVSEQMLNNRHMIFQLPLYHRKKGEVDDVKNRMRSVHVTFENGKHLETHITGTKEEITNYYLTNLFNLTTYNDDGLEDPLTKGKAIVFLS